MMRKAIVAFSLILAVFVLLLMTDEVIKKKVFSEETSTIPLFSCTAIVPLTGQEGEAVQFQGSVEEYEQVTIDPSGGVYTIPTGVSAKGTTSNTITLEVPEGAVSEPTEIGIRLLEKEEVEPILQSYGFAEKYFLTGFEAVPGGLIFNKPIKVTLPSEPLASTADMPLPFVVDLENQIYSLATPGSFGTPEMSLSGKLNIMQSEHEVLELLNDPETGTKIRLVITDFSKGSREEVIAAVKDLIERTGSEVYCNTEPIPCECLGLKIKSMMKDLMVDGECSHIEENGSVQYMNCTGKPIFEWDIKEEQKGDIVIRANGSELKGGETLELKVDDMITFSWDLFDAKGHPIPTRSLNAYIGDEDVVNTFTWGNYSGNVKAIRCGETKLIVEAGCENKGEATIKVTSETAASIKIDPPNVQDIEVCETLELTAKVFDECDNEIETHPINWSWSSVDTGVVDLDPNTVIIEGKAKGTVEITATASDVEEKITLTIKQSVINVYIQPTIARIQKGEELALSVRLEDNCGESLVVEDHTIEWTIPPGGIIAFDPVNLTVRGVEPGTTTLIASCEGKSATTRITVVSIILGLEPEEAIICVGTSFQMDAWVAVEDEDGNEIDVEDPEIDWTLSGGEIASFDPETLIVTGVSPGIFTLTATYERISVTSTITVIQPPASIEVSPEKTCIQINESVQLKATVKDEDGNIIEELPIVWWSNNEEVAAVDQNGLVTGMPGADWSGQEGKGGLAFIVADAPCGISGWATVGVSAFANNYVYLWSRRTSSGALLPEPRINDNGLILLRDKVEDDLGEIYELPFLYDGYDINNHGHVVGEQYIFRGFLYDWENMTRILWESPDPECDAYSIASGINDLGQIVGTYSWCESHELPSDESVSIWHGFIYHGGAFTTFDVPGAIVTYPRDINNPGQILGYYVLPDDILLNTRHSFIYDEGNFITIEVPGSRGNYILAINDRGQVVGDCWYGNNKKGFIYDEGKFTIIDMPGAINTGLTGINNYGQIVGTYLINENGSFKDYVFMLIPCPCEDWWPWVRTYAPETVSRALKTEVVSMVNHLVKPKATSDKRVSPIIRKREKPHKIKRK